MALFTTNYNEVQENDYNALPTGEYEVLILSIKERETPNGKIGMNFDLVVRNDLKEVQSLKETNGKFANRRVFTTEWKRNKNGSYKYELNNFMHYLAAVKVPEGTEIKDLNHLASLLRNKPVRVYIKEEENTYQGNTEMVNTIAPWGFKPTQFENVNHQFKDDAQNNSKANDNPWGTNDSSAADVQDDDLPF
ncbi:DUF669 domain-containing protein [Phocicoccus schoeneichii]|uniref:DUF669 domain-containing protein n=1 Tax=Phocicoccus schoeneichii TaxID=1812261 RepID=UPI003D10C05E